MAIIFINGLSLSFDLKILKIFRYFLLSCPHLSSFLTKDGIHFNEFSIVQIFVVFRFMFLHTLLRFSHFIDLFGMDYLGSHLIPSQFKNYRYGVVYVLNSFLFNCRIKLYVYIKNWLYPELKSICSIFYGAVWAEREVFELFGIFFSGHPDLRRLLTEYGMKGYPLRKTFPLTGFFEIRFENVQKRVIRECLTLSQGLRLGLSIGF